MKGSQAARTIAGLKRCQVEAPSIAVGPSAEPSKQTEWKHYGLSNEEYLRKRQWRKGFRHTSCGRVFIALAISAMLLAFPLLSDRPLLSLQRVLFPFQAMLIEKINPQSRGYAVVQIPADLHAALQQTLNLDARRRYFGGSNEKIEDYIIYGRTSRVAMSIELKQRAASAMLLLLEDFCACELQEDAAVHGIRIYHRGARLVEHLDWPDRWVVSATINVHQNGSQWPLTLREGPGLWGGEPPISVAHSPGQAVLYEGSRLWHGRPEPFDGEEYAGIFIGYLPRNYPSQSGFLTRYTVLAVQSIKQRLRNSGIRI
uniref:Prolyl 4-hydroxylase alpha subunit Fe(2+) 2OG dioxygenase domain-containing protein n=1 Tax=Chrysotila carterae TaxID=13221 RepID=A0A7S4B3E2_CHRCT